MELRMVAPMAASFTALVLILLVLFAGSKPGFMDEYDIVSFNTSGLGKNLLDRDPNQPTPTSSGLCSGVGGFLGKACSSATAAAGSIQSEVSEAVNKAGNSIADELADRLGIDEFYSVHALTLCGGDYKPSASTPGARRNVTECHEAFTKGYNVSALLDHGLRVGRFQITLADLGFTDDIQDAIDTLSSALKAFTTILILGVAFTGLSFLASFSALFLIKRKEGSTILTNLILASLALGFLAVSSLIGTIAADTAADKANEKGAAIGLSAKMGIGYIAIAWVSTGLTLVTFGFWLWHFLRRRNRRYGGSSGSRKHARDSEESVMGGYQPNMRSIGSSRTRR